MMLGIGYFGGLIEQMEEIRVSIWCITYNHKMYIRDAIEGFLMQETDFKFEILIHDDASTDGTSDIILEYAHLYPDKIKYIIKKSNGYSQGYSRFSTQLTQDMLALTHGEYIAYCEGDDFWLDRNKLQKQFEYMEKHQECALLAHNAISFDVKKNRIDRALNAYCGDRDISMEELIMWYNGNFATASIIMRKEYQNRPDLFLTVTNSGDWALQIYCATRGKVHYIDQIMSCYRRGVNGSISSVSIQTHKDVMDTILRQLYFLKGLNEYTKFKYDMYIYSKESSKYLEMVWYCKEMTYDQFEHDITEVFDKLEYQDEKLLVKSKTIFNIYSNDEIFRDTILQFCDKGKKIIIMGAGKWGQYVGSRIQKTGIPFEGYLVSEGKRKESEVLGKKVYEIQEIKDKNAYFVIIAVDPVYLIDITTNLDIYRYSNYKFFLDL